MANFKSLTTKVSQEFIDWRADHAKLYRQGKRTDEQFLLDLDSEIHEYTLISNGLVEPHDDMMVDYECDEWGNVDVKFIDKWYNISCSKMLWMLKQRYTVDHYEFCEWVDRPDRPLEVGDMVTWQPIAVIHYDDIMDNLKTSQYNGFYVDVRKLCAT